MKVNHYPVFAIIVKSNGLLNEKKKQRLKKKMFRVLVSLSLFIMVSLFFLLWVPIQEVPLPTFIRNNVYVRRFLAWDTIQADKHFDPAELRKYLLAHREERKKE
jgi:hypothetical protein